MFYNMKDKLLLLIYCCSFLLISCNEQEKQQINVSGTVDIEVYNQNVEEGNEIEESDSIRIRLKNSCKLCIISQYDSIAAIYDEKNIIVEKIDNDIYLCKPQSEGCIDILFIGYNKEAGNKILSIREVHFKVTGYYENYYITENSYIVNVLDSDITKHKILWQLQEECLPQKEGLFHLYYTGLKEGNFTYISSIIANITGVFMIDGDDFKFNYDDSELVFTVSQMEDGNYKLEQNLTEKFQLLYPQQEIDEVFLISIATKTGG